MALAAPAECEDPEIVMCTFLLDAGKLLAQVTVCEKQAQSLALIPVLVLLQYFVRIHQDLLFIVMQSPGSIACLPGVFPFTCAVCG